MIVPYPLYLPPPTGRGSRGKRLPRCGRCALGEPVCVCAALPRLDNRTRVLLVVHHDELHKPSSSGRLLANVLRRCDVVVRGAPGESMATPAPLDLGEGEARLLYPAADAEELQPRAAGEPPLTLVVPEGTWGQAAKMGRRMAGLSSLRRVRLPDSGPSRWSLRAAPRPSALPTAEAVTRALAILEGPAIAEPLASAHARWFAAVMQARAGRA